MGMEKLDLPVSLNSGVNKQVSCNTTVTDKYAPSTVDKVSIEFWSSDNQKKLCSLEDNIQLSTEVGYIKYRFLELNDLNLSSNPPKFNLSLKGSNNALPDPLSLCDIPAVLEQYKLNQGTICVNVDYL